MQRTTLSRPSSDEVTITGRSRSCAVGDELLEHLEAVHLRHLHVEQQQVEGLAPQHLERDAAVLGATRRCGPAARGCAPAAGG